MPYVVTAVRGRKGPGGVKVECCDCLWMDVAFSRSREARDQLIASAEAHQDECAAAPLIEGLLPSGQVGRVR